MTEFNEDARTFTFDYSQGLEPLGLDTSLILKDYTVTVYAATGISDEITSESTFILRLMSPCDDSTTIQPPLELTSGGIFDY